MHSAVKRDAVGEARMIRIVAADFEQICEQLRTGRLHGALAEQGLRAAAQRAQDLCASGAPPAVLSARQDDRWREPIIDCLQDDFSQGISPSHWTAMHKQWGGAPWDGNEGTNNGVSRENVKSERHLTPRGEKLCAVVHAHGDRYAPANMLPCGVGKNGTTAAGPARCQRVGGVLTTKHFFEPGTSFYARLRIDAPVGVCAAFWTFHYAENYASHAGAHVANPKELMYHPEPEWRDGNDEDGYYSVDNHEIDIEVPGTGGPYNPHAASAADSSLRPDYEHARLNTFIGEKDGTYTGDFMRLPSVQNDGKWHTWRVDWHARMGELVPECQVSFDPKTRHPVNTTTHNPVCRTADGWRETVGDQVHFIIDGQPVHTIATHVPSRPMNLNLGLWFPLWAMEEGKGADFDTAKMVIDEVKVTPLDRPGNLVTPCGLDQQLLQ